MAKSSNIHFVNIDKKNRADIIYGLVSGAKNPKTEGEQYNKERFIELMAEDGIDFKNKEETIQYIYAKLGGAVISSEEQAAKKTVARTAKKTVARTAKADDDDEGESADSSDDDE